MTNSAFTITSPFNGLVDTTTNQVISGTKLFNDPERTGNPISGADLVNKDYVDNTINSGLSGRAASNTQTPDLIDNVGFNATYSGNNALLLTLTGADGNALSSSNSARVAFRDSANTGKFNVRTISSPLTLTISSGSSLGVETGIKYRLYAGLLDVSGTPELCVWNPYNQFGKSLKRFDENSLQTSTALATSSNTSQTIYSTTARPTVPFRYIGIAEVTNTTGAWNGTINANYPLGAGSTKTNDIVGNIRSGSTAIISTSTAIPSDDTLLQISECIPYVSCAYQAQSECNIIKVSTAALVGGGAIAATMGGGIFSGSNANVLSDWQYTYSAGYQSVITATYSDRINNTANVNWNARFGQFNSAVQTVYINGSGGTRYLGPNKPTYIEIQEIFA
jgi:hypothetical protein